MLVFARPLGQSVNQLDFKDGFFLCRHPSQIRFIKAAAITQSFNLYTHLAPMRSRRRLWWTECLFRRLLACCSSFIDEKRERNRLRQDENPHQTPKWKFKSKVIHQQKQPHPGENALIPGLG